jgi:glycosyltransferase involved in cell wall biosynthesis
MPVFNGEKYLREALNSILSQTYQDFELVISDNASIDRTQRICQEYAEKDNRIKYYRNERNFGGAWNFNRTFKLSSGVYFKWAAHDDLIAPDFLQKCVGVLDNDPSIVLCHSKTCRIDENGILSGNYDDCTLHNIASWKPHERFADMISWRNVCWAMMGVCRSSILKKTRLLGRYIFADKNLLAEIGLLGRIYEIPEHLFFRRDWQGAASTADNTKGLFVRDYRKQLTWWTGEKRQKMIVLPHWKLLSENLASVNRAPLSFSEKWLCYKEIGLWLRNERGNLFHEFTNEVNFRRIQLNSKKSKIFSS